MNDVTENPVESFLDKAEHKFAVAPPGINFESEKSYAWQLLRSNEKLMAAAHQNPASLLSAMSNVASIGLSLNPAKRQAYLVPRAQKIDGNWIETIYLEPSYMGLLDVATQSGDIQWVQARCVYSNDEFIDEGVGKQPTHRYNAFKERGEFVGCYCVAKTAEGDYLTTLMDKDQVNAIKERSKAKSGPWVTDFEQMAMKSVIRQAYKTWPKTGASERMAEAVQLSNEAEGFEPIAHNPDIEKASPDQKQYFDQLITASDSVGMFTFMTSLSAGIQTSLYNSFEKGSITKYKRIVEELLQSGRSTMMDIKVLVEEAAATQDDLAIKEELSEFRQETLDWIFDNVSQEAAAFVREALDEN